MSKKHKQEHNTESSHSHDGRREHDRKARAHSEDVYEGGGVSKNMKLIMSAFAVVVVVTLTVMFMAGLIKW